jgi:hypothetical protein
MKVSVQIFAFKWDKETKMVNMYQNQKEVDDNDPHIQIPDWMFDQMVEKIYGIKVQQ